ncbi:MAG: secretion system protein [Pirellulaceae bacterium]|nr:secretion system protein [Pirellulaceae bacterium]
MFQPTGELRSIVAGLIGGQRACWVYLFVVVFSLWTSTTLAQQFPTQESIESSRIFVPQEAILPSPNTPVESPSPPSREILLERVEFSDTPMDQALRLFSKESKLDVVSSDSVKKRLISVSIRNLTATAALKELARQSGTFYKLDRSTGIYTLYDLKERDASAWDSDSLRQFEQELNDAFPDSIVRLSSVGKQLIVRGQAHDVVEASRIIRLIDAEAKSKKIKPDDEQTRTTTEVNKSGGFLGGLSYLQTSEPELTVIDMLTVTGEQQVALRVTVAEVDRNAARQIGLNFGVKNDAGKQVFQSLLTTGGLAGGNLPTMLDNGQIQLAITALRSMSLAKTLAEPTLTSLNGQQASFEAGGQFPIPVVSGQTVGGLQGVSFVPFGINLQFTPYITDRDRIRLKVSAEVSNRAQGNAAGDSATIGGALVPGLDMRKFQTIVELRAGQTLAVAGLISNNQVNQSERVPFFGDLPVVGRLAAFDRISMREQELVILVTPELVHALSDKERPNLPGTDIFEPSDIEFYLGGHMEGTRNENFRSPARTDFHKQQSFYNHRDVFIVGPHGYTECGPQPGVFQ